MRFHASCLTAILAVAYSFPCAAQRSDYALGVAPTYYSGITVEDPNGPTDSTNQFSLVLVAIIKVDKISRIYSELGQYDFKLDAGTDKIGQKVGGYFYSGYYQRRFRITRNFKPWLGVGMAVNYLDFTARHNIDSDGYLSAVYPDRKGAVFNLGVNANYSFELSRRWDFDVFLGYLHPIGDSIKSFRYGGALIYNF